MDELKRDQVEIEDEILDGIFENQTLKPLPVDFTARVMAKISEVPLVNQEISLSPPRLFSWRDAGLAILITIFSIAGLISGGQLLSWLISTLAILVTPQLLPVLLGVWVVQAAVLSYIVWFLMGDEEAVPGNLGRVDV